MVARRDRAPGPPSSSCPHTGATPDVQAPGVVHGRNARSSERGRGGVRRHHAHTDLVDVLGDVQGAKHLPT
eukprot:CAMPEP_0197930190 /NCGR_PEP_ID=MMETSP1439-20131203/105045_1 /TAXON_ID=66791 /ORGANISM="Gonyaulax spinifera, Strain CCMP409" /LENGTH=70 /DNA_ID=CAMNT_0043552873 /DNA_START=129 /DNA_END=342 /DNA_ORIENTATION=+